MITSSNSFGFGVNFDKEVFAATNFDGEGVEVSSSDDEESDEL